MTAGCNRLGSGVGGDRRLVWHVFALGSATTATTSRVQSRRHRGEVHRFGLSCSDVFDLACAADQLDLVAG
jgi:hypothetical protein